MAQAGHAAHVHRMSCALTGKLAPSTTKALAKVDPRRASNNDAVDTCSSSDESELENDARNPMRVVDVPLSTLKHREVVAIPLDVDVVSSDDEGECVPSGSSGCGAQPSSSGHHHKQAGGLWEQAPVSSVLIGNHHTSHTLAIAGVDDGVGTEDGDVTMGSVDVKQERALSAHVDDGLPLTERAVYERVGARLGSDSVPVGDTFVTFKSMLAAVTASGLVCEVSPEVLRYCISCLLSSASVVSDRLWIV